MKATRFLCIMAIAALTSWLLAACNLPISSITVGTDTTAPTIGNLITSSKSVYYNDTSCGPTTLTIIMSVGDDSGFIQSAGVQYRYNDYGQSGIPMDSWRTLNLLSNGDGRFSGTVDVAKEAGTLLDGVGAALEYQAFAVDSAGNIQTVPSETIYSLIVQSCKSGVVGSSPVSNSANAPVSPPKPSSGAGNSPTAVTNSNGSVAAPTLTPNSSTGSSNSAGSSNQPGSNNPPANNNASGSSNPPANNNSSGSSNPPANNNPSGNNSLPPAITLPDIRHFTAPASANLNDNILVEWDVRDACRVSLNGNDINHSGSMSMSANSVGKANFRLAAWGTPCDDSALLEVLVTTQVVNPNASSNGVIDPNDDAIDPDLNVSGDGTVILDPGAMITPTPQVISGFVTLKDGESVDLGDGGTDVTVNMVGSELVGVGGMLLVMDTSGYGDCRTIIDASGVSVKSTILDDQRYCYKTGSGNYGNLYIYSVAPSGAYIEFAYDTEINP